MTKERIGTQTFEEVEAYLIGLGLLKLDTYDFLRSSDTEHKFSKGKEVKEFMQKNNYFNSITLDDHIFCSKAKRRSIGDIFRILKYYCPDITLQEVHTQLNNTDSSFGSINCPDIHKRVWRTTYNNIGIGNADEFGFIYSNGYSRTEYLSYLTFIDVKG